MDNSLAKEYSVKSVKNRCGGEVRCVLLRRQEPVAKYESTGGGQFVWNDENIKQLVLGGPTDQSVSERQRFVKALEDLTLVVNGSPSVVTPVEFMEGLIEEFEIDKQLRRLCRDNTVFFLKSDFDDDVRVLHSSYRGDVSRLALEAKYGVGEVVEIVNERYKGGQL